MLRCLFLFLRQKNSSNADLFLFVLLDYECRALQIQIADHDLLAEQRQPINFDQQFGQHQLRFAAGGGFQVFDHQFTDEGIEIHVFERNGFHPGFLQAVLHAVADGVWGADQHDGQHDCDDRESYDPLSGPFSGRRGWRWYGAGIVGFGHGIGI